MKKLEICGAIILVVIGVFYGGSEIYLRKFANGEKLCQKGYKYQIQNDNASAKAFYRLAIKAGNKDAINYLALIYQSEANYEEAIYYYKLAAKNRKNYDPTEIADLYFKVKDAPKAEKYYRMAFDMKASSSTANLLRFYQTIGDKKSYEKTFEEVMQVKNRDLLASLLRSLTYEQKNYQKAIEICEKINNPNSEICYPLGCAYYHQKDYPKAIKALKTASKDSFYCTEAYFHLAKCYEKMKDYSKAIEFYKKSFDSKYNKYKHSLCYIYLMTNLKKNDECLKEIERIFEGNIIYLSLAKSFYYDCIGNKEKSHKYLKIGAKDYFITGITEILDLYYEQKKYDKVLEWCERTKFLKNSNIAIRAARVYQDLKDNKKAITLYKKIIIEAPQYSSFLGDIYFGQKNYDEAIKCYEKCLREVFIFNPRLREAYFLQQQEKEKSKK